VWKLHKIIGNAEQLKTATVSLLDAIAHSNPSDYETSWRKKK